MHWASCHHDLIICWSCFDNAVIMIDHVSGMHQSRIEHDWWCIGNNVITAGSCVDRSLIDRKVIMAHNLSSMHQSRIGCIWWCIWASSCHHDVFTCCRSIDHEMILVVPSMQHAAIQDWVWLVFHWASGDRDWIIRWSCIDHGVIVVDHVTCMRQSWFEHDWWCIEQHVVMTWPCVDQSLIMKLYCDWWCIEQVSAKNWPCLMIHNATCDNDSLICWSFIAHEAIIVNHVSSMIPVKAWACVAMHWTSCHRDLIIRWLFTDHERITVDHASGMHLQWVHHDWWCMDHQMIMTWSHVEHLLILK